MNTFLIQNDPNRFGFIVEMNIEEHATKFNIHKINAESADENNNDFYNVELVVDGILKFDGCSNLNFGKNGYIHFCETDDLICMNKSLAFIWEAARKKFSYQHNMDEWKVENEGISIFKGNFELKK